MKKSLIALLVIAMFSPVFADHAPGHMDDEGMGKEKKVDQLKSELGLSDEQVKKLEANREKYKSQISALEAKASSAREKFVSTINNPNASIVELEAAHKQKEDAKRNLEDMIFKSRMEYRELLTPEQRTKMISNREEKMERKQERREKFNDWKDKRKEKRDGKDEANAPAPAK